MDVMNRLTGFDLHEQTLVGQQVEFEMFFSLEVLVPEKCVLRREQFVWRLIFSLPIFLDQIMH